MTCPLRMYLLTWSPTINASASHLSDSSDPSATCQRPLAVASHRLLLCVVGIKVFSCASRRMVIWQRADRVRSGRRRARASALRVHVRSWACLSHSVARPGPERTGARAIATRLSGRWRSSPSTSASAMRWRMDASNCC